MSSPRHDLEPTPRPVSRLAATWNADWARLAGDRRVANRLGNALPRVAFNDLDHLLDLCGRDRGIPMEIADATLAEVVAIAAHDDLATRVAVQRILPGVVTVAGRRTRSRPAERQQMFDELMGTAWELARTYPLQRRPVKIAVNLLRDTEYFTCVRPSRLRSLTTVPFDDDVESRRAEHAEFEANSVDPAAEVIDVLAIGRAAGLSAQDLALLAALHVAGRPVADVAAELGVTARTVRNRRHAALTVLSQAVRAAA